MRISANWIDASETQAVCQMLTEAGYQGLFVGGCVRNALLGAPVQDIDIATDALPETVMDLAQTAGFKSIPTGLEHGTVTVISGETSYEITTFRKDVETFGRHAVVAFSKDVAEDALRRDFTINALYAAPDGTVIDPLGGLEDLRHRRFRFIEDAVQRIREDYLRILRFFRFSAWYSDPEDGWDSEALAAISQNLDGLEQLSRERVGAEVLKLLAAPDPTFAVAAMRRLGVLNKVLPGADHRGLGPLVHLEQQIESAPSALRRLAALGGVDPTENLRLSRKQSKRLSEMRDLSGQTMPPLELGYRLGAEMAVDVLLVQAALLEQPIRASDIDQAKRGEAATFPLSAADLQPEFEGPALGLALEKAERYWLASDLTADRAALLQHVIPS